MPAAPIAPPAQPVTIVSLVPKRPKIMIEMPQQDEVLKKSNIEIFVHVENSDNPSEENRFHVFLDHEPPILHEDERKPIVFKNLSEGGHVVRVLQIQPDGLAYPAPDSFVAVRFFIKKKDLRNFVDLTKPYITVSLPAGDITPLDEKQRVCFNFLVHNATLSEKDGYKIRYTLNRNVEIVSNPSPVYWGALPPGRHSLTVELLDASGNPVLGLFSRVERNFEIAPILRPLPDNLARPDDEPLSED